MNQSILIVEDDRFQRETLASLLRKRMQAQVLYATHGREAMDILGAAETLPRLVIMDLEMPVMGGMETLELITQYHPGLPVIMLTATSDLRVAVQALQMGAVDFLTKPWIPERIITTIQNTLALADLRREVGTLKRRESGAFTFADVIGADGGLSEAAAMGRKASVSGIPVLLSGETGVGKDVFARAIHGSGVSAGKPFIAVNCGAIPPNLVESTLFGHEKGAFTGAVAKAPGKFREAHMGTIFLDEVGELPLDAQTRLLRVVQQKEVEPVGGAKPVPVDVRIISATNRDLEQEVRLGRFREDLYFRLNVLHIPLPPLRARKNDIAALVQHFLSRLSSESGRFYSITPTALAYLETQAWEGNVRALENALYRASVLSETPTLGRNDFLFLKEAQGDESSRHSIASHKIMLQQNGTFKTMAQIESETINAAMQHFKGNVARTAAALGISKATFYRRLKAAE